MRSHIRLSADVAADPNRSQGFLRLNLALAMTGAAFQSKTGRRQWSDVEFAI